MVKETHIAYLEKETALIKSIMALPPSPEAQLCAELVNDLIDARRDFILDLKVGAMATLKEIETGD